MSLARSLHLIVLAAIAVAASAQTIQPRPPTVVPPTMASKSTADLIKVSAEIRQLRAISTGAVPADRWQILWLHQRISEQVMAASLQVDATIAQIDNEIARANEVRGYLADRRDHSVSRANLLGSLLAAPWARPVPLFNFRRT
jgi:hypothetical protein